MRLPPTFPICDVLGVIFGKGLCTNETPAFTQRKPVSEVRERMEYTKKENVSSFLSVLETGLLFGMQQLESTSGEVPGLKREICSPLTQQYIISNPNHPSHLNVNHSKNKLSCVWA